MTVAINEAWYFKQPVSFKEPPVLPAGCIDNAAIEAAAGIAASKLEHQFQPTIGRSGTAAAETSAVHRVNGATATIVGAFAGCIGLCTGNAAITVDIKKNGTTVLSAPIALDASDTARVAVDGTLTVTTAAEGDLLEAVVAVNAGTGALGTGLFFGLIIREDAQ